MENLYTSLYDDNDELSTNLELSVIEKISGQRDPNSLSKYLNIEDYISATESLCDNYFN